MPLRVLNYVQRQRSGKGMKRSSLRERLRDLGVMLLARDGLRLLLK